MKSNNNLFKKLFLLINKYIRQILLILLVINTYYFYNILTDIVSGFDKLFVVGTLLTFVGISQRKILNLFQSALKGRFLFYLVILLSIINIFSLIVDFDHDNFNIYSEIIEGSGIRNPDSDSDIMKDGIENKNKNYKYGKVFDVNNSDINQNDIVDFCDVLIAQKLHNDNSFNRNRDISQYDIRIGICNEILSQNNNFNYCNSNDVGEILFNMTCDDLMINKISLLKQKNYTHYDK
jgi:hypothetical protein